MHEEPNATLHHCFTIIFPNIKVHFSYFWEKHVHRYRKNKCGQIKNTEIGGGLMHSWKHLWNSLRNLVGFFSQCSRLMLARKDLKLQARLLLKKPWGNCCILLPSCVPLSYTRKRHTLIQVLPAPNVYIKTYFLPLKHTKCIHAWANNNRIWCTHLELEVPEWVYALFWCKTVGPMILIWHNLLVKDTSEWTRTVETWRIDHWGKTVTTKGVKEYTWK